MTKFKKPPSITAQQMTKAANTPFISLYDSVVPGREFESLINATSGKEISGRQININVVEDIQRCLKDIEGIRGRPAILYMPNVVNSKVIASTSIDYSDDLPFSELISTIPSDYREIDVIIVTPGGSGVQAAKFVEKLRSRFDYVGIIIPDMAMSAGTIFAMSGDEIVMTQNSYIGPIDPQVPNRDGRYVPAQSLTILVAEIQKRGHEKLSKGKQPDWTDLEILHQLDPKDLGDAINASNYSMELVETYLKNYKFRTWDTHSDGRPVTEEDRNDRAKKIASQLCDHSLWKSHSRGITRDEATSVCQLKITRAESIGLDESVKKLWAIAYWIFENSSIYKMFISNYYILLRHDITLINPSN